MTYRTNTPHDRLAEIKHTWPYANYSDPCTQQMNADLHWLIAEVERLREVNRGMENHIRILRRERK